MPGSFVQADCAAQTKLRGVQEQRCSIISEVSMRYIVSVKQILVAGCSESERYGCHDDSKLTGGCGSS
jgi:hypothetical protein